MRQLLLPAIALLAASALLAQGVPPAPEAQTFSARQDALRQSGTMALAAEETRSKARLCSNAGSTMAMETCFQREQKTTDANYTAYIRAIGGLIRLTPPATPANPSTPPQKLSLDRGEDAWLSYREQGCRSVADLNQGGTMAPLAYLACRLTVTSRHMEELSLLYSGLWR